MEFAIIYNNKNKKINSFIVPDSITENIKKSIIIGKEEDVKFFNIALLDYDVNKLQKLI